ncbi:hypothetical protein ABK040_012589 [Willaertia magna]
MPQQFFKVLHQSTKSGARVGEIITKHGKIQTPNFVPVGTNGTIKGVDNFIAENDLNVQLMFCNTYHLMLYPEIENIEKAGGLHKFINRNKPIITDSGGFQVFSLQENSDKFQQQNKNTNKANRSEQQLQQQLSLHNEPIMFPLDQPLQLESIDKLIETISSQQEQGLSEGLQQALKEEPYNTKSCTTDSDNNTKKKLIELKGQSKNKNYIQNLVDSITENGVNFRSYRDGKKFKITPEISVTAQYRMGSDIIIPFDELLPEHVPLEMIENALDRTHRWELRSLACHLELAKECNKEQHMYCVLHGGTNLNLRKKSMDVLLDPSVFHYRRVDDIVSNEGNEEALLPKGFEGIAIGGSLGSNRKEMLEVLEFTFNYFKEKIPSNCFVPNHVLGIGDIESIQSFIPLGVDTCDSAYPTRLARHGSLIINASSGQPSTISLKGKASLNLFDKVIDKECDCSVCKSGYSIAYLHHLFKSKEPSYVTLSTIHNVRQMMIWMERIRELIMDNKI